MKHVINLEVENITKPSFALRLKKFMTYHWKGLCHSKMELKLTFYLFLICLFYNNLIKTFYFHKVFIDIQTISVW